MTKSIILFKVYFILFYFTKASIFCLSLEEAYLKAFNNNLNWKKLLLSIKMNHLKEKSELILKKKLLLLN